MVLDTSAIVAILFDEPERDRFARAIAFDPTRLVSAGTMLEAGIVVEARRGESAGRELDLLLHRMRATVVALDEQQADIARSAWRRFGKGDHPAGLNLGDCFAYALARVSGQALLHKGDDFGLADIDVVRVEG